MKNMKKLWAALLALAMTFSLAACGGTSDEDAATDDQPTGEEVSGDTAPESDVGKYLVKASSFLAFAAFICSSAIFNFLLFSRANSLHSSKLITFCPYTPAIVPNINIPQINFFI